MFNDPVPDVQHAITRPVAFTIATDLMKVGLLPVAKSIDYRNYIDTRQRKSPQEQQGQAHYTAPEDHLRVRTATTDLYQGGGAGGKDVRLPRPVFGDSLLGVRVDVVYSTLDVAYEFEFTTSSRNKLVEWQQAVRSHLRGHERQIAHTLTYVIPLSNSVHELLETVHTLRESQYGYGDTYEDYIRSHLLETSLVLQRGPDSALVVGESQIRSIGRISYTDGISEIKTEREGLYSATIKYTHTYRQPEMLHCAYPTQIHQQTLPNKYLPITVYREEYDHVYVSSPLMGAFRYSYKGYDHFYDIRVPDFDTRTMARLPEGYTPVVTILTEVEGNDPQVLINLNDIGDAFIEPDVLDYIADPVVREHINKIHHTQLMISLYKDDRLLEGSHVFIDEDLNVRNRYELDPRHQYRVCLSIMTNTHQGLFTSLGIINNYPKARTLITELINHINHQSPALSGAINTFVIPTDWETRCALWNGGKVLDQAGNEVDIPRRHPDINSLRRECNYAVLSSATVMSLFIEAGPTALRN